MGKPHKHAALIKAWADGAEIQFKSFEDKWIDFDFAGYATWDERTEYRIKPKEVRLEAGKFYKTRNGLKVRIYTTDGGYPYKIHGAVLSSNKEWLISSWTVAGERFVAVDSDGDIIGEWENA